MKIMTRFNATFKNFIFVVLLITALVTVLVFGMPVSVDAYDEIDTTSPVTLAVEFLSGSKISGMEFRAYKVANMNLNVTFEFTEEFSGYNITMARNQAGYRAMAETLASYIERDGIEPCKIAVTDETGRADFGTLERGLYLVMAPRYVSEEQKMANVVTPCLVALPNSIDGEKWMYDVTVSPKITEVPVPQEGAGKTNITVETDWTEENTAGKRPSEITVELISDGSVISVPPGASILLSASDGPVPEQPAIRIQISISAMILFILFSHKSAVIELVHIIAQNLDVLFAVTGKQDRLTLVPEL